MSTAKFPFPTSPIASEKQPLKTGAVANRPIAAKKVTAQPAAKKSIAAKPAGKKTVVSKAPAKVVVKSAAKAPAKKPAKTPARAVVKPIAKSAANPPIKPVQRKITAKKAILKPLLSRTSVNPRLDRSAPAAKLEKARKPKLVRDSFTIPKAEYLVLEGLKQRANKLTRPAKKSELLRAGIKALAALSDAAFLTALAQVPAIRTGLPNTDK